MFRPRQKKTFPPGTFIPTPARVMAIIQLCLAFIVILWNATQPFMGELFDIKSKQLLAYDVMGIPPKLLSGSMAEIAKTKEARLERNAEHFQALPHVQQQAIIDLSNGWQRDLQRNFLNKLERSFHILAYGIPPFEQAWLLLSFVVPILLLKRVEGAKYVVWLLPLVTLLYAVDNRWHGISPINEEAKLFPSEKVIASYLEEPLSADVFMQQTQLMNGWKRYLSIEWAKEKPATDVKRFEEQAEKGEFRFNLARLETKKLNATERLGQRQQQVLEPLILLALYFFWNLSFSLIAWRAVDYPKVA